MYIIALAGREEGVYSVINEYADHVIYMFEEEDDAERYLGLLEASEEVPELCVVESDADLIIKICEEKGYKYTIIKPDDIVVPPRNYD